MTRPSGLLTLETNTLRWVSAFVIGVFFLVLATIISPAVTDSAKKFGVSSEEKPITELYFSAHTNLPKSYLAGRKVSFEVTMESSEVESAVFNFEVLENDESGIHLGVLETGSITLTPRSKVNLEISVRPRLTSARTKITFRAQRVSSSDPESTLSSSDLKIHFWAERR
jgi:hypothetical protein